MSARPLAIVIGFVAKSPVAGMALYNFHYIAGLRELGYDVHYVERLNGPDECYDPSRDAFGDDPGYGIAWMTDAMARLPAVAASWTLIDRDGTCHGTGQRELDGLLDRAAFVLTLCEPTWFDALERCPRRAFVDGDPLFTQAALRFPDSAKSKALAHYPTLFTYWTRQGAPDTTVPTSGREWISTTAVVATALWQTTPVPPGAPITTVMNWGAWGEVELDGRRYGHKNREFARLADLPQRVARRFVVAVGGPAPKAQLVAQGWKLANPLEATQSIESYRDFIAGSYADLGIAKHAYVASRSGWFSDRGLCYLASGRPVLHQDTGFTDWLEPGRGVFPFADADDVVAALAELERDYDRHAAAARALAEDRFEARKVIGRMLADWGL